MMDELINRVAEKTGLSQGQAQAAVGAVLTFLKERLPEPIASRLDSLASGGEDTEGGEGMMGKASGALGSLFRKES